MTSTDFSLSRVILTMDLAVGCLCGLYFNVLHSTYIFLDQLTIGILSKKQLIKNLILTKLY